MNIGEKDIPRYERGNDPALQRFFDVQVIKFLSAPILYDESPGIERREVAQHRVDNPPGDKDQDGDEDHRAQQITKYIRQRLIPQHSTTPPGGHNRTTQRSFIYAPWTRG